MSINTGIIPSLIIFINDDITFSHPPPYFVGTKPISQLQYLQTQLFIDDVMTKREFDARMKMVPDYATITHLRGFRLLVILSTFQDYHLREYADVVCFLHQGLVDIERNRFGPPAKNLPLERLTPQQLFINRGGDGNCGVPWEAIKGGDPNSPFGCEGRCNECLWPFRCDRCHTFSGIPICNTCNKDCKCACNICGDINSVYLPNCNNEYHNSAFIHRK